MSAQKALFTEIHDEYYAATTDALAAAYRTQKCLEPVERLLDPGARDLLDLACGNGFASRWLKGRRPELGITGIEISDKSAAEYERATGGACHVADFTKPFSLDRRFDGALVFGGIHHFVADLDTAFDNIDRLLLPGASLIMVEPNADYVLQPLRSLWYRLDRAHFDAATERALSHGELLARYSDRFVCEHLAYAGGPAALLVMHNWALRVPQSWKPYYFRPLMALERAWDLLPGRLPFNFFIAKWRKRG